MRLHILKILAKQVWISTLKSTSVWGLIALMGILLAFSVRIGYKNLSYQQALRSQYQREVRENGKTAPTNTRTAWRTTVTSLFEKNTL